MSSYSRQLKIDRYNLVAELERQPQLFMDWALQAARAEIETKEAENDYDLVKGEAEKKVRRNPINYGIEKVTEGAIKAEVNRMAKVKKYYRRYLKALADEKVLKRAEKAFQQRKGMLESLVQLNVQLHFAEPNVPQDKREVLDRAARGDILKDLKRTRKKRKRRLDR